MWQDWEPDAAAIMPLFIADDARRRIIAMKTDSTPAQVAAIAAGIGLGFLPTYFARLDAGIVPVDFGMAFRRTIYLSAQAEAMEADGARADLRTMLIASFDDSALFGEVFVAPLPPMPLPARASGGAGGRG